MKNKTKFIYKYLIIGLTPVVVYQGCGGFKAMSSLNGGQTNFSVSPTFQPKYSCPAPTARGKAVGKFQRMLKDELANTLRDLLGADIMADSDVQVQFELMNSDKIVSSVNELSDTPSSSHVMAMAAIANRVADLVMFKPANSERVFGVCASQQTADCIVKNFVPGFALKAYRRPLTTIESDHVVAAFNTVSGEEGLKRALMHVLLAPPLAFHVEIGTVVGDRVRLSDYEVASRLSYQIAGTTPDAELLQAAGRSELSGNLKNVTTQAKRLIAQNADARKRILDFFRIYLLLDNTQTPNMGMILSAGFSVDGLREEMLTEINEFISNIVFVKQGSFDDLLTAKEVFPRSDRMAKILETSVVSAGSNVPANTTTDHAGLILRPAFFAGASNRTNPMVRASRILKRVMCVTIPAPDPNAVNNQMAAAGDLSKLSNRDRFTALTKPAQCISCHSVINPVGFALEGYDQLGMKRSQELIVDAQGKLTETYPIDTRYDGKPFEPNWTSINGGADLSQALVEGSAAKSCFAKSSFEYLQKRVIGTEDSCALNELEISAASGRTLLDIWIAGAANEDIFWKSVPQ